MAIPLAVGMSSEARLVTVTIATAVVIGYLAVQLAAWNAMRRMG